MVESSDYVTACVPFIILLYIGSRTERRTIGWESVLTALYIVQSVETEFIIERSRSSCRDLG